MNEYNDISSNAESISDTSESDWVLSTSEPNSADTSSYSDSDYLQSIYEINLVNTAFTCVIMFILIIGGLTSMMKNFFE